MRKVKLLKNLTDYIVDNRRKVIISFICLVSGVVIGSLSAIFLDKKDFDILGLYMNNFASAHTIQPINRSSVFAYSIYNNIKVILFMWVSGFWIGLIPLGFLQLCAKGYKIGFATVFLVQLYSGKGILFSLVSVLPQFILTVPTLIFYNVFNFNFALTLRKIRQHGQTVSDRKDLLFGNLICLAVIILIFTLNSLIDTFIVPSVLKPICSYLF